MGSPGQKEKEEGKQKITEGKGVAEKGETISFTDDLKEEKQIELAEKDSSPLRGRKMEGRGK